jgi:hypothetical protein
VSRGWFRGGVVGGEQVLQGAVPGRVVGVAVVPALADDMQPGAGEDPHGVRMVLAAGDRVVKGEVPTGQSPPVVRLRGPRGGTPDLYSGVGLDGLGSLVLASELDKGGCRGAIRLRTRGSKESVSMEKMRAFEGCSI